MKAKKTNPKIELTDYEKARLWDLLKKSLKETLDEDAHQILRFCYVVLRQMERSKDTLAEAIKNHVG